MNIELKAGTASLESFRKDFEKLLREKIPGLWFHTLESASEATWRTLTDKMGKAFEQIATHADHAEHTVWFAFCVLDTPELVQFQTDFGGEWRGRLGELVADARRKATHPPYRVSQVTRRIAAASGNSSGTRSYGTQQKLLIYAPTINPSTFLHLSIKGESYALREFPLSGQARRWVIDDVPTTRELTAKHSFVHSVDVTHERKSLQSEPGYWRQRIAALNSQYLSS